MSYIFISYKRVDKDRVFEIKDYIERETGLSCWIDLDGIESDAQFKSAIIKAIKNSDVFLFMYSNTHTRINDLEKDWTMRELDFASQENKRIVFINIDGTPLIDELSFDYGRKQQVDARDPSRLKKLVDDLKKWIQIDSDTPQAKTTPGPKPQLPPILAFSIGVKRFSMVLSEDRKYYIGNIKTNPNDFSWIKEGASIGPFAIGSAALAAVAPIAAGIVGGAIAFAFGSLWGSSEKNISEIVKNLSKKSGYVFSVPTADELGNVDSKFKTSCVTLRVENNPLLQSYLG